MGKYGKGRTKIACIMIAALFLAGCGAKEEKESISVNVEMEDSAAEEKEETKEEIANRENADEEIPEGESGSDTAKEIREGANGSDIIDEPGNAASEKKEPPEDFELTLASEDWGLSFGESGTQPIGNASVEDLYWYDAYYMDDGEEKIIYLTFDCGYENGNTEPILDALKKHDVQATFFVVGHFLETAPELAKRMVEEGHAVGNHTYHHPDMSAISDMETFGKELDDVADLFHEVTGADISLYYRPPQGKCNVENMKMAQGLGYRTIFWSLAYVDWDAEKQPSHEEAFEKLTTRIHPGAIVLLHNTSQTNGEILDELLTKWEEMGYRFRPLADLEISINDTKG